LSIPPTLTEDEQRVRSNARIEISLRLRLVEPPGDCRCHKLYLHEIQVLEFKQRRSASPAENNGEVLAEVHRRKIPGLVQGPDEMEPPAVIVLPRGKAAIVMDLTVL
jgi:hypothetical protein